MGLFFSRSDSIMSDYFTPMSSIGEFPAFIVCDVALMNDFVSITSPFCKQEVTLKYDQITDVFYGPKSAIVAGNKSPIARALLGGILLGGVGALVGAISGTGQKERLVLELYFIISYVSSNGEEKFLEFQDKRRWRGKKLALELKRICKIADDPSSFQVEL